MPQADITDFEEELSGQAPLQNLVAAYHQRQLR